MRTIISRFFLSAIVPVALAGHQSALAQMVERVGDSVLACDNGASCSVIVPEARAFDGDARHGVYLKFDIEGGALRGGLLSGFLDHATKTDMSFHLHGIEGRTDRAVISAKSSDSGLRANLPADIATALFAGFAAVRVDLADREGEVVESATLGAHERHLIEGSEIYSAMRPKADLPVVTRVRVPQDRAFPEPGQDLVRAGRILSRRSGQSGDDTGGASAVPRIEFRAWLDGSTLLWGVETDEVFYNAHQALLVTDAAGSSARPPLMEWPLGSSFELPGRIHNGRFDPVTMTLHSYLAGRAMGDCGASAEWVWDGAGLRLTRHAEMPFCIGVPRADWPVLWRAEVR